MLDNGFGGHMIRPLSPASVPPVSSPWWSSGEGKFSQVSFFSLSTLQLSLCLIVLVFFSLFLHPVSLLCSSLCPSISPFLTISPDPLLILILLPHSSITHFSHFCIYTKDDGLCFVFTNPPKSPVLQSPKYRSPKPLLLYHPLLYTMS